MSLRLRRACQADMDLLFQWANDAVVRSNAFHTEQIPYENHVKWFQKMMADASVCQYLLCDGTLPVGQIRLNIEGNEAVIDYSIAAEKRGKGYGSELLRLIAEQIRKDKISDVIKLVGLVKYENKASARAFEKSGYDKKEQPEYIRYECTL
ncbi:MAG: GNAT family N-acetyltransferase [Lachnospiraceae bacterium]|nr:GNAT family N-acetyltransferase [Lachnospiraceae bacterium]